MKINKKIVLLLLTLCSLQVVFSKEETISKTFPSANFKGLSIDSKYGEIKIENWEKAEIQITVSMIIHSNKTLTEEKIYNNISVNFQDQGDILIVQTEFGRFFSFMKMSNSLFRGGELAINFLVKAPESLNLDISLVNGDIILFKRDGDVKLKQQDGTLSALALYGENQLMLKGCNAKLTTVNALELNMKSGAMTIEKVNDLLSDTYSVDLKADEIGIWESKSIRDKIEINKVKAKATVVSNMSSVKMNHLLGEGFFTADYGTVMLKQLGEKFDQLKINGKGADIAIGLAGVASHIAVNHHQSTKIEIPESFNMKMSFGEDNKNFISTGLSGDSSTNNKLLVNCKGGELFLR